MGVDVKNMRESQVYYSPALDEIVLVFWMYSIQSWMFQKEAGGCYLHNNMTDHELVMGGYEPIGEL